MSNTPQTAWNTPPAVAPTGGDRIVSPSVQALLAPQLDALTFTSHGPVPATPVLGVGEVDWLRHTAAPAAPRTTMTTTRPSSNTVPGDADSTPSRHPDAGAPTHPRRHQRTRTTPAGAHSIYVGRGTPWGNPFKVVPSGADDTWAVIDTGRFGTPLPGLWSRTGAARLALDAYSRALDETYPRGSSARTAFLDPLRGHDLCCWCPPQVPCHADLLLRWANPHLPDPRLTR